MGKIKSSLFQGLFPHGQNMFIILAAAFLLSSPLLSPGLYTAHDLPCHMFKLTSTVRSLGEGQIPPLIGSGLANNFGYAWNLFYPPLTSIIPAFFKIFLPTYTGAMKLFIFLTIVFSGLTLYFFACDLFRAKNPALLASFFYMAAPYRLEDIYIRGAMGEVLSFVFLPVLFHGLYNLFHGDGRKDCLIAAGAAGLLLSHNISALLGGAAAVIYILFHLRNLFQLKILKALALNSLFIFLLTLFFYVPLLEHRFFGNYEVFLPGRMGSLASLKASALYPQQLLFSSFAKNTLNFTLGLQFLLPLAFLPVIFRNKFRDKNILIFLFLGLTAILMTTVAFPWNIMPPVFSFIQFPWRLLLLASFFLSLTCAYIVKAVYENLKLKDLLPLFLLILLSVSPILMLTDNDGKKNDAVYTRISILSQEAEYSPDCAFFEYLPVKAYQHLPYLTAREDKVLVTGGRARLSEEWKNGTALSFQIEASSAAEIELPYIYYLGWDITLQTATGSLDLEPFESPYGFLSTAVPAGVKGQVSVKFQGTWLTRLACLISLFSFLAYIGFILCRNFPRYAVRR